MKYIFSIIIAVFFFNTTKITAQSSFNTSFNKALETSFKPVALQNHFIENDPFAERVDSVILLEKHQDTSNNNYKYLESFASETNQYSREIHLKNETFEKKDTINILKKFNPSKIDLFGLPLAGFSSVEPAFDNSALINNTILVYRLK